MTGSGAVRSVSFDLYIDPPAGLWPNAKRVNVEPYTVIRFGLISPVLFIVVVVSFSAAVYNARGPVEIPPDNFAENVVSIVRKIKPYGNGSYYFLSFPGRETRIHFANIMQVYLKRGAFRFDYGTTWKNFCWPRNVTTPFVSLLRSAQLSAAVSVPLRLVVLSTMTARIVFALLTTTLSSILNLPRCLETALAGCYLLSTIIEQILLFACFHFHYQQDKQLLWLLFLCLRLSAWSVLSRSLLSLPFSRNSILSGIRLLAAVSFFHYSVPVYSSLKHFHSRFWCDGYVVEEEMKTEAAWLFSFLVMITADFCEIIHFECTVDLNPPDQIVVSVSKTKQEEQSSPS